ncbi:tetratricopeptide repeat protein [Actinomadura hibisca]|uniref:tetratricopeptide repeat protein n=1 Tax=Actinomadura hibisca TaxID=68565 RepID=UPI0035A26059
MHVPDELADLPWETLTPPGMTEPLALHPRVHLFRSVGNGGRRVDAPPGPLRVLVAMADPDRSDGVSLDLEAELAKILDAVERPRRGAADRPGAFVNILNLGTVEEIREALLQQPYHVLHISCHAAPGKLLLEDAQGAVDEVTTERFVRECLPAGRAVPLLVLSGCSTALGAGKDAEDEQNLSGLARGLVAAGVPAVLAMTAPVTDPYATELAGALYYELAMRESPDVLAAVSDARRLLEEGRRRLAEGTVKASLVEWATPALFLAGKPEALYDPKQEFEEIELPVGPELAAAVPLRKVGQFVGRRRELRALLSEHPHVLLHGIGGVGKSSLAAELLRRLGRSAGMIVSAVGTTTPDQLLGDLGLCLLRDSEDEAVRRLANEIRQPAHSWQDRLKMLAPLLARVPVTLLLDNFEDNLRDTAGHEVGNEYLSEFLAAWIRMSGVHRTLITCRYTFALPQRAHRRLKFRHLGPLSLAEARKLMWRLPGLDALSGEERVRAWADVGGHPRTLEYLDALLRGGEARFPDVRERLEDLLERGGVTDPDAWFGAVGGDFDAALAESVTLAARDVLLGDLLGLLGELERRVLVGVSVFQRPVDRIGAAWLVGTLAEPDPERDARLQRWEEVVGQVRRSNPRAVLEDLGLSQEELEQAHADFRARLAGPRVAPAGLDAALAGLARLGLVTPVSGGRDGSVGWVVHRWTASALARPAWTSSPELGAAHQAAADYHWWRYWVWPQDRRLAVEDAVQARFHAHAAGDLDTAINATRSVCDQLHTWGAWDWEQQLLTQTLPWTPQTSKDRAAILHQLGLIDQQRGEYESALQWYRRALTIDKELGDRAGVAVSYHQLGMIDELRGEYERALQWYRQSLTLKEELGDRAGMARTYHQLSTIDLERGEYEQALQWCRQSLTLKKELGDRAGIAVSYHQLGIIDQLRGEYEQALQWYRRARTIAEELGDRAGIAIISHHLGMIDEARGEYEQALRWYRQSLIIKEELGDRAGMAISYHHLGTISEERGEYEQALQWYRLSLTIAEELGDRGGMAISYGQLGVLFTQTGQTEQAVGHSIRALLLFAQLGSPNVGRPLNQLNQQRQALGPERFRELLITHTNAEFANAVINRLDAASPKDPS